MAHISTCQKVAPVRKRYDCVPEIPWKVPDVPLYIILHHAQRQSLPAYAQQVSPWHEQPQTATDDVQGLELPHVLHVLSAQQNTLRRTHPGIRSTGLALLQNGCATCAVDDIRPPARQHRSRLDEKPMSECSQVFLIPVPLESAI